ncbi:MAG: putative DNA binding domain-containing protein [Planctomycetota bacterium]|nr:putative DNA binding domain-containing protein [Planctomycetota bacterium]
MKLDADSLREILESAESFRIERTTSESNTDKFGEAICAFSNDLPASGKPGYLVVGVEDATGRVVGVKDASSLELLLANIRSQGNITPMPMMSVNAVEVGGKHVVIVEVQPSVRPPVRYKGRTHVRIAQRRDYASIDEERQLAERATDQARTWDLRACQDATLEDLALELFLQPYLPNAVSREVIDANGREIQEQLASLRFFDLRKGHPTNAGVLVFGKDPLSVCPGAYVQFVEYEGMDQASSVLASERFSGDLATVLRELDRLAQRLARERPVRQPDLTDTSVYDFPPRTLHELFMNAVIHRNYENSTSPVSINLFADRLELLNPGSLYGELASGGFPNGTSYRNPVIAEAAKTLGFVNRFGRGIAIAQAELQKNQSPPAELKPIENHFLAIVRRRA